MSRVIALVATIPPRRRSCMRLLDELTTRQTRKPDGVVMVWDGFAADVPVVAPPDRLPLIGYAHNEKPCGAGARWLLVEAFLTSELSGPEELRPIKADDTIVCLDDDIMTLEAPRLVESLVAAVEGVHQHGLEGCAAAAMGRSANGKPAPPGDASRGQLLHGAGCGLTVKARHLKGLRAFADEVKAAGGPDALGVLGDDDALVSAFLWRKGIPIIHTATGNIYPAPNTQASSTTHALMQRKIDFNTQKRAIRKVTGWPWVVQ